MKSRALRGLMAGLAVVAIVAGAVARITAQQHDTGLRNDSPDCAGAGLECASFATPYVDSRGRLWVVWAGNGVVSVAKSSDGGRTFSPRVAVTPSPLSLDTGPDARPQILLDSAGRVVVAFSIFTDTKFSGQVQVARSTDDGASFESPHPIVRGAGSQRFVALHADDNGGVFAAWVDKGRVAAARAKGESFAGASLVYAWSLDGGATFDEARVIRDGICECCRLAVAGPPGQPVVLFRNIFQNERDHAVVAFSRRDQPGPILRVSADNWAIDGCPHHGPSLAVADGRYHAAWFTGGSARQGAFYARSIDGGRTFSEPMPLSAGGHAQRPFVAAIGSRVWAAWKEFDSAVGKTAVMVQASTDGGVTWTKPRVAAAAAGFSDHPLLVSDGRQMYLSWLTRADGYRLIALNAT